MDNDEWHQKTEELLQRLEAKFSNEPKLSAEKTCHRLRTRLTQILDILRRRPEDALQYGLIEDLYRKVDVLSSSAAVEDAAVDLLEMELCELMCSDPRIFESERIVADLELLSILSERLKWVEQQKQLGNWSDKDESAHRHMVQFYSDVKNALRDADVSLD